LPGVAANIGLHQFRPVNGRDPECEWELELIKENLVSITFGGSPMETPIAPFISDPLLFFNHSSVAQRREATFADRTSESSSFASSTSLTVHAEAGFSLPCGVGASAGISQTTEFTTQQGVVKEDTREYATVLDIPPQSVVRAVTEVPRTRVVSRYKALWRSDLPNRDEYTTEGWWIGIRADEIQYTVETIDSINQEYESLLSRYRYRVHTADRTYLANRLATTPHDWGLEIMLGDVWVWETRTSDPATRLLGTATLVCNGQPAVIEDKHQQDIQTTATFVGNSRSEELHTSACVYASRIHPENLVTFETIEAALASGYNGCMYCMTELDTDAGDRERTKVLTT
jgi:hypothetical protein